MTDGEHSEGRITDPAGGGMFELVDALPALVWATDTSLRLVAIAGRLTSPSSPEPKQRLGQTIQEIIGTDDFASPPLAAHRRALDGQATTYRYSRDDRVYEGHVAPLCDSDGRVTGCVGVGFDITARAEAETALKKAREGLQAEVERRTSELQHTNTELQREIAHHRKTVEALHESEARFRAFIDHNPAVTYMKDEQGRHVYGNEAWAVLFSKPLDQLIGTTAAELFPPDTAADFEKNDQQVRQTGQPIETIESGIGPDGQMHWWQAVKFPLPSLTGKKLLGGFAIDVTEHRRAVKALRESEERFRSIYEYSPLGIAMVATDTQRIVAANPQMCRLLDYSEEELLALTVVDITHPDDVEDEMEDIAAAIDGRIATYTREKRYIRKDGSICWVKLAAAKVDVGGGQPLLGVGIVEDITQRRTDEEARRRTETTLRTLLNAIPESAFLLDRQGNIVLANQEMARRFNRPMDELVGVRAADLVEPEVGARRFEKLAEVFRTGRSIRFVDQRLGRHIDQILSPVLDDYGNVELVAVLGLDITERLDAEKRLLRSEYEKSAILESMSEMFAFYDTELNIQWVNRASADSVGMEPEDLVGKKCYAIWHQRQEPCEDCPVLAAKANDRPEQSEVQSPDGRWWQLRSAPVYDADGKLLGLAEFGQDITQRKRHQELLAESKLAAEESSRAKSEFLANMSHEIRTPMTAILGYTELLMNVDLPVVDQARHLQTIHRNAELLLALINDILDLSKIEAGKLTIEKMPCSPIDVVEEVVALMRVRSQQKSLPIGIHYEFPLPARIVTDPVRLRQILLNLVGNAVKFTEDGWIRVSARLVGEDDSPPKMEFAVTDSGIGLTEEEIPRLFATFSQLDTSTTRRFGGTGLGLAISKRLAVLLGGDIRVRSTKGEGSTFTLSIDPGDITAAPELFSRPAMPLQGLTDDGSPGSRFRGRVLLAEDGQDNRELIGLVLESAGVTVRCAENGRQAYQLAVDSLEEGQPFDLILMDIQMPEVDGDEATRQLRAAGWNRPIVALTAHAMSGDREKYLAAGCDDYLSKPVQRRSLFAVLRRFLETESKPPAESGRAVESEQSRDSILADSRWIGPEQRVRLMELFRGGLAERVDLLRRAVDAADLTEAVRAVHAVAGSAAMFGFEQLAESARSLEKRMRDGIVGDNWQQATDKLLAMCEDLLRS